MQGPSAKSGQGLLVHSKTPAKLKIRPKGQRAQSFADLGRMFRPGSALLAPPSSDAYFDMLELEDDAARDDDEDDSMDLLSGASPVSKRTSNTTLFRHKT